MTDLFPPARHRFGNGFTLIELVVTMIIVGILAIAILPRFDSLGAFDAAGFSDQTQSLLRYAQKSAIAQRRWVSVDVGANPPTLCSSISPANCSVSCASGTALALPGGRAQVPASGTTFSAGSVTQLCFDAQGRPVRVGDSVPMTSAATLTVLQAGASFRTVTIEAETGYVH